MRPDWTDGARGQGALGYFWKQRWDGGRTLIEWSEEGLVLAVRKHGEGNAIVEALTRGHGRHLGVVRGGAGRKLGPLLQPGAQIAFSWRARLEDHMGAFTVEPVRSRAGLLGDPLALAGLSAVTAILSHVLPEREAQPILYAQSIDLLDRMAGDADWPLAYLFWEMELLEQLGFGLDLTRCAVTGSREDLAFVSPRTGRAVSREAAGDYAPRLLALPPCLLGQGPASASELMDGLRLSGHFLTTWLSASLGERPFPAARARLISRLTRQFSA